MLLLIAEVAIAVGVAVYKDDFKAYLKTGMEKGIKEYTSKPQVQEAWDTIQKNVSVTIIDSLCKLDFIQIRSGLCKEAFISFQKSNHKSINDNLLFLPHD